MNELEPHDPSQEPAALPNLAEHIAGAANGVSPLSPLVEVRGVEGLPPPIVPQTFGQRIGSTEGELARLSANLRQLRLEWERSDADDLRNRYETLRRAVQRYSVACAEVDVCIALIHARTDPTGEAAENLRRSLEEQTVASNELRSIARSLHAAGQTG